ncbi:DUF6055 domain-containing protein [Pleionea sp. CnH1-48]|uniref:DUF6055 domain-containing protein n=1 Tax=Pleionea sp. CnH1-48 TaxID=2954494 RepID=UPI002097FEA9|nr:DUF6055 domain-containing protein [Pleionea sp. CnH1-48]MCO7226576.1 DUF6055 domain-containing protein [Pleionea sp. CnH1-48]
MLRYGISLLYWFCIFCCTEVYGSVSELTERNPYNLENSVSSEHFVIYWQEGVDAAQVEPLLDILEHSWESLVIEQGYERPITMQNYKLNVYLSGTGSRVPYNHVLGGYAILDRRGHEAFVMHKDIVPLPDNLIFVLPHEFFHTIQSSYGLIRSDAMVYISWLTEATASWAVGLTDAGAQSVAEHVLAQYAFYPHYTLYHESPTKEGSGYDLLRGHHYGAYLFFVHLTELTGDQNFVRHFLEYLKTIARPNHTPNAVKELDRYLIDTHNITLSSAFAAFSARNALWDYPDQSVYVEVLASRSTNHRNEHIARRHAQPENRWHSAPVATLPRRFGSNYIELAKPSQGNLLISFQGASHGSLNASSEWHVSVVTTTNGIASYTQLPLQNGRLDEFSVAVAGADKVMLAIAVTTAIDDHSSLDETFLYQYKFAYPDQQEPASGGGAVSTLLLLLGLVWMRRR